MSTIGVLGGGQLGRMLALAGVPLGLRFRFYDPAPEAPAADLGEHVCAGWDDLASLQRFAAGLDVATFEFENVPVTAATAVAGHARLYPSPSALQVTQDRLEEKQFLRRLGLHTATFAAADASDDVAGAVASIGFPAVAKQRRHGYDGRGQLVVRTPAEAEQAWDALGREPLVIEAFVPFERELSLVAVRSRDGDIRYYPLVENHHANGILRWALAPAPGMSANLQGAAEQAAARILDSLDYVGVLTIEFFERRGRLLVNELAPRVHNSGHWTIEGAESSQFENHLRAILGLPLGSTRAVGWSVLHNVIGALPDTAAILAQPRTHLHLYGKAPRPGRKLGHVTARVAEAGDVATRVRTLHNLLDTASGPPVISGDPPPHGAGGMECAVHGAGWDAAQSLVPPRGAL